MTAVTKKTATKKAGGKSTGPRNTPATKMADKAAYVKKSETRMDEISNRAASVIEKIEQAVTEGRVEVGDQLENAGLRLQKQLATVEHHLDRLRASGEESWKDMETSLEKAWEDLAQSIRSLLKRIS